MAKSGRSTSGSPLPGTQHARSLHTTHRGAAAHAVLATARPRTAAAPWHVLTWLHACATSGHASMKKAVSTCGSSGVRHGRTAQHVAPHTVRHTVHCTRRTAADAPQNGMQYEMQYSAGSHAVQQGQCAMHRVPGSGVVRLGRERLERARHEAQQRRRRHGHRQRARQPRYPEGHERGAWVGRGRPHSASRPLLGVADAP